MNLVFGYATDSNAFELAALHSAVAERLTRDFGVGMWSASPSEKGLRSDLREPKFSRILIARDGHRIVATLRLATRKPWAIDPRYFTDVERPLYLTAMAVHPEWQREGIGRLLLEQAVHAARGWPADAIRLDAFDAAAGAGPFYAKCGFREVARVVYKRDPLIYFEMVF